MAFILDSAAGGSSGSTFASWNAPTVTSARNNVLLLGWLMVTGIEDIDPPAGWTQRAVIDNAFDDIRVALFDRTVPVADSPYEDVFASAGAPVRWSMGQQAFASTGPVPGVHAEVFGGEYPDGGVASTTVIATLSGATTPGTVLVATIASTTYMGVGGGTGAIIPAGWQLLETVPGGDGLLGAMATFYKIADGTEDDLEFGYNTAHLRTLSVLVAEYPIDPTPEFGWDVYEADDLLGDPIATLENAKGRWIRSELHGLGEGGFVINRHVSEATEEILAEGNMVKVRIPDCGPDYIDGFFLPQEGDYTLLSAQGGKGREDLTFRGLGALSYLDRARMTPCAFSIPPDIVGSWDLVWKSNAIAQPVGVAFDSDDPDHVYVIGLTSRKIKKLDQDTREVVATTPALWDGSSRYAAGLSFDPDDDSIAWALEAPWLSGSGANTKIRKIDRSGGLGSWEVIDTFDLGSAIKLTDIRVDGDFIWTSRYDNDVIQQRSKSTGNVVDSSTITYKGKVQRKPNGIAINGTKIAYWFGGDSGGGTGRALIADTSDPWDITDVQKTTGISAFGGEWTTEGGEDFLYAVSYTEGKVWKYQLTESVPACADESGVLHPEQVAPGALAWRVLVEITHDDRPVKPVPDLTFDFTEEEDSNGTPWPERTSTEEFTWSVGDRAYSDVLARLIPAGVTFDLDVNTMVLHAYVDGDFGTDRTSASFGSGKVRFAEGVNLAVNGDLGRRDNRGAPDTYITVAGDGRIYGDATLAGNYVREGFLQVSGPTTGAVLDAIGDDELARQRLVADALGFETLWADDPLVGRYIPKLHYWKGDLVTLDMVAGEFAYNEEELRVYGTLITERDGGWRSAIDLGSAYKIPGPISSIPGDGKGDGSSGGGKSGGKTVIAAIPLTVSDGEDINIPRVTKIIAEGVASPEPGVAVFPSATAATEPPLIEELLTDETDPTLVYAPDGVGGVIARVETSGPETPVDHGAMGSAETIDLADGTWHRGELDDDVTITVTGYTVDEAVVAVLKIESGGTHAIAWDPDVVSIGDDQAGNGITFFLLFTDEGDSTIYLARVGGSTVAALDDLSDVAITGPSAGEKLRHDGSGWVNSNLHDEPMIASDGSVMTDGALNPMMHEVAW